MRFDAYAATIKGSEVNHVVDCLSASIAGSIPNKGTPMRRYATTVNIDLRGHKVAWVGQDADSGSIYVEGKGDSTPALVKAIREHFPTHSAPRIDVAEDYDEPGAFERLQGVIRSAKGPKVKGGYVAFPDDQQDGRTWAAGVRGGVGYLRLYEAGKHPDRLHLAKPDWVRAEVEARPHYARDKAAAAKMEPLQVWGLSAWTHRVGQALTQCTIERFEPEARRYSFDKTTRYIFNTYRRHFEEMRANGEDIERTAIAIWAEEDEFKRRYREH
jgi:hypothetical protein